MDREHFDILESFIESFVDTPWFSNAHEKYPSAVVVEDIVVGWDGEYPEGKVVML